MLSLRPLLAVCAVLAASSAAAQQTVLDAVDRGWYNLERGHNSSNKNTLTGICCGAENFNSFFVFDLRSAPQAGAVTLRLELEEYSSSDPAEPFAVFDVTSDIDQLRATHSASDPFSESAYQDLQSGVMYGMASVTIADRRRVIEIELEPAAVRDVNDRLGGFFAVGLHLTDQRQTGTEWIRFSSSSESKTHQLVLAQAPFFEVRLQPSSALSPVGRLHTVDLSLVDGFGEPVSGASVAVAVLSGPGAGVGSAVTTNQLGVAQFTYAGNAGKGIDVLGAVYDDGDGHVFESNRVQKIWDDDCNANGLPDSCDVDCAGFDGLCATEISQCGGSSDIDGDGIPDECNVPPDCESALPSETELWPPNHTFRPVGVIGVSDPDGDPVRTTITAVHQDELVDEAGSGQTCPDATNIGASVASLAAERSGTGDGRVYHVEFRATDGRGGSCTGSVRVCVPHSRSAPCGDQGQLFDAAICSNIMGSEPQE